MGPQALHLNLNTLLWHEMLTDNSEVVEFVTGRIADDEIRASQQLPYQHLYRLAKGRKKIHN
jgi:hypothetical protein